MKKTHLLLAVSALALAACSPQRPEQVTNPDVLASNAASSLDLTKVVASDSTTVLHFDVTFTPGQWIRIDESSYIVADADTLPLLGAEGIEPGAEFTMPESGRHSFSLAFGPLAPSVQKITFSEGNGGWTLVGIDLMGNARTEPDVPAKILRESDGEVFAEPIMEVADTEFKLHIADYTPQLGSKVKVRIVGLGGVSFEETLTLNPNGTVDFTAPVYGTSWLAVSLADFATAAPTITVAPGKKTEVYLDPRYTLLPSAERLGKPQSERHLFDNGRYASLNTQLSNPEASQATAILANPGADLWRLSPAEFTDSLLKAFNAKSAEIDDLLADRQFKDYLKAELTVNALMAIQMAPNHYLRSFYSAYPTFGDNWRDSIPALPGRKDYELAAKTLDISAPALLMIPQYRYIAEEIDFNAWGVNSPQAAEVAQYVKAYTEANTGSVAPETLSQLQAMSDPFYARAVEARATVMAEKVKAMAEKMHELPDVADEALFDAIVEQYKGKVVLVDLWNTWCGPCRRALAANEPLKTGELSDPDIVWVYIADESSDLGTYAEMIGNIAGEHYKVNKDQIAAIRSRFNVDGIPYYILVDREGNAIGHPDFRNHSLLIEGIKSKL